MSYKLIRGGYSESINMLRFPLAILVVFVHSFGADIDVSELHARGLTGLAVYDYIRLFFSVVIARSAVPLFFIISGYLLFLKVDDYSKSVYMAKLKKRWHSLVIPYLLWLVLFILWNLMFTAGAILLHGKPYTSILDYFHQNGYLHMFWDSNIWGERTNWMGMETHKSGPVLLPFWYMRDLIIMVILSPFVYYLIKKIKSVFIVLLLVIYAFDFKISWISGTFACASLFFSMGAYFAIRKLDFTEVLWKWRYLICPIAISLMVYQTYSGSAMGDSISKMVHPWMVIFQSFAFIIIASQLCKYSKLYIVNMRLARTSFFIYALHPFVLGYVIVTVNNVIPLENVWLVKTFNYLFAPLICVGICIGVYWVMQKLMPTALRVIVGERIK